jgi:hypothetical protein
MKHDYNPSGSVIIFTSGKTEYAYQPVNIEQLVILQWQVILHVQIAIYRNKIGEKYANL